MKYQMSPIDCWMLMDNANRMRQQRSTAPLSREARKSIHCQAIEKSSQIETHAHKSAHRRSCKDDAIAKRHSRVHKPGKVSKFPKGRSAEEVADQVNLNKQ